MSRRFRATALVALSFGGLLAFGALIIFARQSALNPASLGTRAPITPQTGYIFTDVEPSKITRISVVDHGTGRTITYTRVPGDWNAADSGGTPNAPDLPNIARMIQ